MTGWQLLCSFKVDVVPLFSNGICFSVGQAILAPIFSVKQLRDSGVTLHILIDSQRDPVPDVPAVYFCQPTDANLYRIGLDLEANLYGSYHFNFISPISRQKMEDLASKAIKANVVSQVN